MSPRNSSYLFERRKDGKHFRLIKSDYNRLFLKAETDDEKITASRDTFQDHFKFIGFID